MWRALLFHLYPVSRHSAIGAVPASAASVKVDHSPASTTVIAVGEQQCRQFADAPEMLDIVAARCRQANNPSPALNVLLRHMHQHLLAPVALSSPCYLLKARVLLFHRLILFPFHGFW